MSARVEQLEFQAEARQLLDLMVHSVYSNKDSFLRELISNASDALDKLRLEAFRNKDLNVDTSDLHIEIEVDKGARTLTVRDNGIGMTRDEVVGLIGTLAKSGTAELRQQLREAKNAAASEELIGQFGIGFYSTFMVADTVELRTRKAGESAAIRWESSGEGTYTIESVDDALQGTSVKLHLKPDDPEDELHDYTSDSTIKALVKQYSDFIAWPIRMEVERRTPASEEGGEDVVTVETETINSMKALWARPKDEVSDEEYKEFYKHIAHAWDDPLEVIPMKAEGTFEYQALLFIPSHAPFDLFNQDSKVGVQLYVKRVFIMSDCDQLMPHYLRFVKGVVDAQDLSLNVSREILQKDRQINAIRRRLTKKVLSTIKDIQTERPEDYRTLWTQFGRVLKEGAVEDTTNRDRIAKLLRYSSTQRETEEQMVSLSDYVSRMKEGQTAIYYITADGFAAAKNSPHLEIFRKLGVEVLLMHDRIDEWVVSSLTEFEGKPLQSIAKGGLDLSALGDETVKKEQEQQTEGHKGLVERMQKALGDRASAVRVTYRLTDSPACLVSDEHAMSTHLERMLKAAGQNVPNAKPVLEINPGHPIVRRLNDETDETKFADWSQILFDQATLAEGGQLEDPATFVKRLNELMLTLAGSGPSRIWTP